MQGSRYVVNIKSLQMDRQAKSNMPPKLFQSLGNNKIDELQLSLLEAKMNFPFSFQAKKLFNLINAL